MLEIHKNYVFDENHQSIAVQIPIAEFEKIEEVEDEETLSKEEALKYLEFFKKGNVD